MRRDDDAEQAQSGKSRRGARFGAGFFGDGEHWMKEKLGDRQGNRCLVGALCTIRRPRAIKGDGAGHYLRDAMPGMPERLVVFKDYCRDFADLKALILRARKAAAKDIEAQRDSDLARKGVEAVAA